MDTLLHLSGRVGLGLSLPPTLSVPMCPERILFPMNICILLLWMSNTHRRRNDRLPVKLAYSYDHLIFSNLMFKFYLKFPEGF